MTRWWLKPLVALGGPIVLCVLCGLASILYFDHLYPAVQPERTLMETPEDIPDLESFDEAVARVEAFAENANSHDIEVLRQMKQKVDSLRSTFELRIEALEEQE